MKKSLLASYVEGIKDIEHGESYGTIFKYFLPEFVTCFLLYSLPFLLDSNFISHLRSTPAYATLGTTNDIIHFLIKVAEAFGIGTVILAGQYNGQGQLHEVGRTVRDAFWLTCVLGLVISASLYVSAYWIYAWYGLPEDIIQMGIPFLRLRALSVFLTFVFFAITGFLRGIKNTRTPMKIFLFGTLIFIVFDYGLIFGAFGLPEMGLQGSAMASVIQYAVMLTVAIGCIVGNKKYRSYGISLFSIFTDRSHMKELIKLSWPVILDKATLAFAYIWLGKMIAPMGVCAIASRCAVKDLERFSFLPAIACAQVITFLVSNDFGIGNWQGIKSNIKKTVFLSSVMVFGILMVFCTWPDQILLLVDKTKEFSPMAARAFPILSVLVFFDLLQLILSGALRGASNVKTVMFVRIAVCFGYFFPISYLFSNLPIENQTLKFILIYGSFYIGNGLMSIVYINRFRSDEWQVASK